VPLFTHGSASLEFCEEAMGGARPCQNDSRGREKRAGKPHGDCATMGSLARLGSRVREGSESTSAIGRAAIFVEDR